MKNGIFFLIILLSIIFFGSTNYKKELKDKIITSWNENIKFDGIFKKETEKSFYNETKSKISEDNTNEIKFEKKKNYYWILFLLIFIISFIISLCFIYQDVLLKQN